MRCIARSLLWFALLALMTGCPSQVPEDGSFAGADGAGGGEVVPLDSGGAKDTSATDTGSTDTGSTDTGSTDAGAPDGSLVSTSTPGVIKGLKAVWIDAGSSHACTVGPTGAVWCWGTNSYDETAPKGAIANNKVTTPMKRGDVTGATRVATGHNHTCALLGDGSVGCWGSGGAGQLGDGLGKSSQVAVTVKGSAP